jgi:hypothetical protein
MKSFPTDIEIDYEETRLILDDVTYSNKLDALSRVDKWWQEYEFDESLVHTGSDGTVRFLARFFPMDAVWYPVAMVSRDKDRWQVFTSSEL